MGAVLASLLPLLPRLALGTAVARATAALSLAGALALAGCARDAARPESGEILYRRYCASCHGVDGRGDGPAAGALSPPPTDLTRLRASVRVLMRVIDGRRTARAHGSVTMPVWGEVFERSLIGERHRRRTALLKTRALAQYVRGLQTRR
jgi:mono/diheme cytochrome c family protein